ncbi:MAG: hypothetical protein JSV03_04250 [Planctomycetota bacterium]|nr:MAG: hypothetical protein JSV03_04250 [Planctomycetota bacterium]
MIDIDHLPIPDWGLLCPHCKTPLAGMPEHRCSQCGEAFNIRVLLGIHRPIPEIGLMCPQCDYNLTGLMVNRCPECGSVFSVREMLEEKSAIGLVSAVQAADPPDHHLKRREPIFTGEEKPLPDFGLSCAECGYSLTDAMDDQCPGCGALFDLNALVPKRDWVDIRKFIPPSLGYMIRTILYDAQIPYLMDNTRLRQIYGFDGLLFSRNRLQVPRSFFWDTLYAINQAERSLNSKSDEDWLCPYCNEAVPGDFDICWNCNTPRSEE